MKTYIVVLNFLGCVDRVFEKDRFHCECLASCEIEATLFYDCEKSDKKVKCICVGAISSISKHIYILVKSDDYYKYFNGSSVPLFYNFDKANLFQRIKIIFRLLRRLLRSLK